MSAAFPKRLSSSDVSATGTRQFIYYQPVVGKPGRWWCRSREGSAGNGFEYCHPLLVILIVFAMLAYALIRFRWVNLPGNCSGWRRRPA